ncbi:restriction endonuclease [Candidatus Magnetobacterium bavaricum]|uniref:Restriction endonuclease n=1 Tax=Candidatus Magnetobacterium bavaricum TaxID=29290 RepID=A0A0F3GWB1_9BACT|nr:restriction endonuclease [Candidatus Magnetobacterium bavaricum]
MAPIPCEFDNPSDFEKHIKALLEQKKGRKVELATKNKLGYDIELKLDNGKCFAIQVKCKKVPVGLTDMNKFIEFLRKEIASRFNNGILISGSGFSKIAITYLERENINLLLGAYTKGNIWWYHDGKWTLDYPPQIDNVTQPQPPPPPPPPPPIEQKYIGVFTCKGGVGKTTVAAHLAGAFAENGHDVILIDLDKEGNLKRLMGNSVYVPPPKKSDKTGNTVTVLSYDDWHKKTHNTKIVVCDCNPNFDANPIEFMEQFDYCIVPTMLTPLGVNKNADVIKRTFENIRRVNKKAELFVLINAYHSDEQTRNETLNTMLKKQFETFIKNDPKCHYIDPDDAVIRYSKQLVYWGYECIVLEKEGQLAFDRKGGGTAFPRLDFFNLLDHLLTTTIMSELEDLDSAGD